MKRCDNSKDEDGGPSVNNVTVFICIFYKYINVVWLEENCWAPVFPGFEPQLLVRKLCSTENDLLTQWVAKDWPLV